MSHNRTYLLIFPAGLAEIKALVPFPAPVIICDYGGPGFDIVEDAL
jgi:hypothetical protein